MPAPIVIIHGPMASGKTTNAYRLRQHYGCTRVVDDWAGQNRQWQRFENYRLQPGDLALTNLSPADFGRTPGARIIGIKEALHAISGKKPRQQP